MTGTSSGDDNDAHDGNDDDDILRGDRDVYNRDRQTDYYNTKVCDCKSNPTLSFNH